MTDNWFDTAQICVNGHVINPTSIASPLLNKRFCEQCGGATVTKCQTCTAPIRGVFHGPEATPSSDYSRPAFCHNCGSRFPWTR